MHHPEDDKQERGPVRKQKYESPKLTSISETDLLRRMGPVYGITSPMGSSNEL